MNERLSEDSDVIELTDEVAATGIGGTGASERDAQDDLDALTREMPEFRVPDQPAAGEAGADDSEEIIELQEPVDPEAAVPSAAILTGRRKNRPEATPVDSDDDLRATVVMEQEPVAEDDESSPAAHASDADGADAQPADASQPEADEEPAYDRQEMVKTIQMTAIDRGEFERQMQARDFDGAVLLLDHSRAPDVLVFPPRVLTTRWQEGGPLLRAGKVSLPDEEPAAEPVPADAGESTEPLEEEVVELRAEASDPDPDTVDDELPEIDPDAVELELDSEVVEDAEVKPPPQPAPPPKQQATPAKAAKPAQEDDPELSGLVQELLDESKQAREKQRKKSKKPRSPRETWFQKVFTDEYLRTLPTDIHRQTKREADFIEESFALGENARVLDLACGFGRHAIELCRRGLEVVGLDLSMPLLQKALNEAQKQSLSIKFLHGDMRDLSFEQIFDACYVWQTSFGYFDDQTNFRVLRGIHRGLRPGGRLLIDVLNRDHIVTDMPHRLWWEGVNCVFLEEVELDHRTSVLHTKRSFIYEDGTPPLEQNTYIRVYALHELRQLLQAAGFVVREVSGELHHRGQFLGPASSRIIIHAEKRPPKGGRK